MISLNWVGDYIDIKDENPSELAVKVTKAGINVEAVVTKKIDNLVIGQVVECSPHPDSDHLNVCKVNIGKEVIQIVCGAPNVRKDLKVIVALVGAVLPGDFKIKKSKIRGVESNGMICALFELGLEEETEENYNKGIHELDDDAPVGEDPIKYLELDDTLYELDIHKHRNNDCYYHIGFAYEIAAILNKKVTLPKLDYKESKDKIKFNLEVKTDKCSYYVARSAKNVVIKESPDFIKQRLTAAGMRPINNVVDISNYVMLEFGQPLHFFDRDKLGDTIVVRDAKDKEKIVTLDGDEHTLTKDDIVITDGEKAVCIAGVMGGENTEVDLNTKNILIESAIFNPVNIRNTSKRCDLPSEASIRYGKGLNYEYTEMASKRACHLLEKYADATIEEGYVLVENEDHTEKVLEFVPDEVNKLLGMEISEEDMKHELERLDFPYKLNNGKFIVTVPRRRLDIDPYVNDIAEEIGRLYGYNNLVSTLPKVLDSGADYAKDVKYNRTISKRLRNQGLNEVITYTLVSPEMAELFDYRKLKKVVLPNPMSIDKSVVRTSLIPSLLNTYNYNKARKVEDVFIYEISKIYDKDYNEDSMISGLLKGNYVSNSWNNSVKVDFYIVKGIVEDLLNYLGFKNRYSFEISTCSDLHPGVSADIILDKEKIGIIGKVHPKLVKDDIYVFELSMNSLMKKVKNIKYKEAPKYPEIEKDMAFILDKDISAGEVINTIRKAGGRLLSDIDIFDIYTGENIDNNKKSIAFKLTFVDLNKTLTDEEVMEVFNRIIDKVEEVHKAKVRDN